MARSGRDQEHGKLGPPLPAITGDIDQTVEQPELWPRLLADLARLLAIVVPPRSAELAVAQSWPGASVALHVGDLEDTGLLPPDVLCAVYGLTSTEARLAMALGRGRDLTELADDWQVSVETLRARLKGVFAKSGTRRQTDLVRLLAGMPWRLANPPGPKEIAP